MKITMIDYPACPYCRQALKLIDELKREHPEYGFIEIEKINEVFERRRAAEYDGYYYCPSFFYGKRKLYEADPSYSREEAKEKLGAMLASLATGGV